MNNNDIKEPKPISDVSKYWYEQNQFHYQLCMDAAEKILRLEDEILRLRLVASLYAEPFGTRPLH